MSGLEAQISGEAQTHMLDELQYSLPAAATYVQKREEVFWSSGACTAKNDLTRCSFAIGIVIHNGSDFVNAFMPFQNHRRSVRILPCYCEASNVAHVFVVLEEK